MSRRSRAGGQSAKSQRRKTTTPKRRNGSKAIRQGDPSVADLERQLEHQAQELIEARELQAATAEVLRVISISPHDIQPVFDTIAENAARICQGRFAFVARFDNELLHFGACHGLTPEGLEAFRRVLSRPASDDTAAGRAISRRAVAQIPDVLADRAYGPLSLNLAETVNYRSILAVPMLRDGHPIGVIAVPRAQVGLFSVGQIALLQTFAAQAVIAIENTRLFKAEQQRTRELSESLEQQTATSEVLKVISSSPGDLQPVFDAMLENGVRACGAKFGVLFRYESGMFHPTAMLNVPPAFAEVLMRQGAFPPQPGQLFGRLCESKSVIQIEDRATESHDSPSARYGGARSAIAVPMLKVDELVGAFFIYRTEVQPFTNKQIELVQNFAAQAVIAIENARLLNELRESLQQQTATSEVLSVISSSPGELKPVFDAILENATRICQASFGTLHLAEGNVYRTTATYNVAPAYAEARQRDPIVSMTGNSALARVAKTKSAVQIADVAADPAYRDDPQRKKFVKLSGARTIISLPMLKDDTLIGAITVYRLEVRPFTDKQIGLVQNFAAQAVIAIENTRLLSELRESLQQQTATADVLRVISSSPGELTPVFDAILANATRICEAKFGTLTQVVNGVPTLMFQHGVPAAMEDYWRRETPRPSPRNALSHVVTTGQAAHVADLREHQAYLERDLLAVAGVELGGIRTLLVVPMLKDEKTFGTIGIYRQELRHLTINKSNSCRTLRRRRR